MREQTIYLSILTVDSKRHPQIDMHLPLPRGRHDSPLTLHYNAPESPTTLTLQWDRAE